jgi:hypothetical protein
MKVINPFIIDGPLNVSDIEMCEFVDHLQKSKYFKKYKNSDHLLCNVPLHYLMTDYESLNGNLRLVTSPPFSMTLVPLGHMLSNRGTAILLTVRLLICSEHK